MLFSNSRRTRPDPDKFPVTQLLILALLRVSEPIALTSIFPYAWRLVLSFDFCDKDHATFYAGLLISAFALSEALTGMIWGCLSDRIGRKPVLLLGSAGTCISLLIVGLAPNFWVALLGRALGGALNGNIGVLQSSVGEITVNPKHEPRAFSIMPFVWCIGTILGPMIGGYFAYPSDTLPDIFPSTGLFGRLPYLLPNLVCIVLMLCSMTAGALFLQESHPDMQPWSKDVTPQIVNPVETTSLLPPRRDSLTANSDDDAIGDTSYGSLDDAEFEDKARMLAEESLITPSEPVHIPSIYTNRIMMLVVAFGLFAYVTMSYDHLLPIFLQDALAGDVTTMQTASLQGLFTGGLGLSLQQVGTVMAIDGAIALVVQGLIFPWAASKLGIWRLFVLVTIVHPIAYVIVPYLVLLPEHLVYPGLYLCLTVRNLLAIMAYPLLLILLKDASPSPKCLGKINGLAASTGAACRTLASPIAGLLYGIGSQMGFSAIAWWATALVAVAGAIQVLFISQRKGSNLQHAAASAVECHLAMSGENEKTFLIMLDHAVEYAEVSPNDPDRHTRDV